MNNLDYEKLINERKLYYIKYGRGAVIGISCESLEEDFPEISSVIRDEHGPNQSPVLINAIDFEGDCIIFDIIIAANTGFFSDGSGVKYKVTKKIPLSQITFEKYELNE